MGGDHRRRRRLRWQGGPILILALLACPHASHGADVPDVRALCALVQDGGTTEEVRAGAIGLGYLDVWVGSYGTVEVGLPRSVPRSRLVAAWGVGKEAMPLHLDDPVEWRWDVPGALCTAIGTIGDDDTVAKITVVDDRGPADR